MIQHTNRGLTLGMVCRGFVGAIALALTLPACGPSAVNSGVAVGKVGRSLSARAMSVPQGAQVCALQEALAAPSASGAAEKPTSETCNKAIRSDVLWRKAMIVLAAYSEKIEAVASGTSPENAGQLEAALTGVQGPNWVSADGPGEPAARDAVTQLVTQMATPTPKSDLDKSVKDAAPHVKTLCDGLGTYLDTQVKGLEDIQKDIDKKRATHADRRCTALDNRSICMPDSVIDRLVYANAFGQIASMQGSHQEARDAVATFCAAHRKLEGAAANGQVSKDQTYIDIIDAVKAVPRAQPPRDTSAPAPGPGASPKPVAPPPKM